VLRGLGLARSRASTRDIDHPSRDIDHPSRDIDHPSRDIDHPSLVHAHRRATSISYLLVRASSLARHRAIAIAFARVDSRGASLLSARRCA